MKFLKNFITPHQRKFSRFTKTVFILLLFIGGFVLVNILKPSPKEILKLPQDPAVQVYFNQNQASSYEDPYRHFTRKGDNLVQLCINS